MATAAVNKTKASTSVNSVARNTRKKPVKQVEEVKEMIPVKRAGRERKHLPTMLTLKQASESIGVNLFTIKEWCKSGQVPHVKSGKRYLINEAALIKFLGGTDNTNASDDADRN